nr:hypothetical protein [Tanacetum cinerariifolium]
MLYVAEGLLLDKQKTQVDVAAMIAEAVPKECDNLHAEINLQVNNAIANIIPLHDDEKLRNDDLSIWWSIKINFDKPAPSATHCRTAAIRPRDHDDHHDDAHLEGENSAKRKERLSLPTPKKPALVYHNYQKDPKAPPMTLFNQDLFNLKHSNSRTNKYTLSLHKYHVVSFTEDDIKEQTSRWHKFITEIMLRRSNGKIDLIKESNYKYLNKNDIEDLYMLRINGKVKDYRETGLLGSLIVFVRSTVN